MAWVAHLFNVPIGLILLVGLVSQTIDLRVRYLLADELTAWEEAQQELTDNLDENSALARYLTSRNQRIDLDDDDTLQVIQCRLKSVAGVLERRLAETARFALLGLAAAA